VLGADGIIRKRVALRRSKSPRTPPSFAESSSEWKFGKVGMLSIVVLFGDEALGDRLGDPACVRPRQEKAGRIAVGKPPVLGLVRARYGPEIVNRLR
jgi:hypothetical protein